MQKLSDFGFNIYSQFGEDGIIERIFQAIGTTSKVCVEFGAWDGVYLSNTANLWTKGWKGILIEADPSRFKGLIDNTKGSNCICINKKVNPAGVNSIEHILRDAALHDQIDYMSIDIDGDDYYIMDSLQSIRPRVISCEYNPTIPIDIDVVPNRGNHFGCSALALIRLSERIDYALVSMTDTNCFFVRRDYAKFFSDYDTTPQNMCTKKYITHLFTGYNGEYVASNRPVYGCTQPLTTKIRGDHYIIPYPRHLEQMKYLAAAGIYTSLEVISSLETIARRTIARRSATSDEKNQALSKWFADNGDKTLRLNYSLDNHSVVFDVGGYLGNWASDIFSMYQSNIHVFEPVNEFYNFARNRFSRNSGITLYNFGLSDKDEESAIYLHQDSSGTIAHMAADLHVQVIKLRSIKEFIEEQAITKIDLIKINIEGGEYRLLQFILDQGLHEQMDNIQIQFHDFVPNAKNWADGIRKTLEKTHYLTYKYEFVWENWSKRAP